jgi:hypothetical protein
MHGTRMMSWQEIREFYGREVVNLRNEGRWVFLNTLFSVSEAVMYMQVGVGRERGGQDGWPGPGLLAAAFGVAWNRHLGCAAHAPVRMLVCCFQPTISQLHRHLSPSPSRPLLCLLLAAPCCCLRPAAPCCCPPLPPAAAGAQLVDRLDQGAFSTGTSTLTYQGLYRLVAKALYRTHVEGKLKGEIIQVRAGRQESSKGGRGRESSGSEQGRQQGLALARQMGR